MKEHNTPDVFIQSRYEVPVIYSVKEPSFAEGQDFRNDELIKSFMENSKLCSMSWVKLENGEELEAHRHPTESMIIVTSGSVYLTGDLKSDNKQLLNEGDVVCINVGSLHGFKAEEGQTFKGLSIQFEGLESYEMSDNPRVALELNGYESNGYESLIIENNKLAEKHHKNSLYNLVRTGKLNNKVSRKYFLHYLLTWSEAFQKMIHVRHGTLVNKDYKTIYDQHLLEEIGHDKLLSNNFIETEKYDAQLEAACNWFVHAMYDFDEIERLALVHMVIETSGDIFGNYMKQIISGNNDYFDIHAESDDDHASMGNHLFKDLNKHQYERLIEIIKIGWEHMDLIHERISCLVEIKMHNCI